jgi:carbamoyltransferase
MLILGINASYHDTAAVIVRDGEVIAALEEERLNRVKHTNAFPRQAMAFCLEEAEARIDDVDRIAINVAEEALCRQIATEAASQVPPLALSAASYASRMFQTAGFKVNPGRLRFVPHHVAHGASAMFSSGFDEALVLSLDGLGEDSELDHSSGILFRAAGSSLERLRTMTKTESLGFLYGQITKLLKFREFDEYKVMGLAPNGDACAYRHVFQNSCQLTSDGWYQIDRLQLMRALYAILQGPQIEGSELTRIHRDVAAACQELLETVVFHFLRHYRRETGLDRLAMAGGVALNCSLNGKIAASGLFKDVFVQPASHDAGGALGAALFVASQERPPTLRSKRLDTVYWGPGLPEASQIEQTLNRWSRFIDWRHSGRIANLAAQHIADGSVIAWVQSRSEFGPRALGNRSILADPRPAKNRDIVNAMVKKREGFRPFAPSVLKERASDYFELPPGYESLPFMLFVLPVRPEQQAKLGAITHVDGSARVQTVDRATNAKYWELIHEFGEITGIFMLLNTSFNNSAEPIVDSVEDAIVTFITTGLHYLAIDDYWIGKREVTDDLLLNSAFTIAPCAEFGCTGTERGTATWAKYRYESAFAVREPTPIAKPVFEALCNSSEQTSLRSLLGCNAPAELSDIRRLWWLRLIKLHPIPS